MRHFIALFSLATIFAGQVYGSQAIAVSDGAADDQSAGSKSVHFPRVQAETAPCVEWADPAVRPRVVLLCIHGLGLHKGSYESFGKAMSHYGIVTYAIDVRGFGEWQKSGQHTTMDLDGSLSDIKATLERLRQEHPGLPVVILGESMGGAIALRVTALYPDLVAGLISSVPAGDRYNELGQSVKVGARILTGGMHKPLNIGHTIVNQGTKKDDLRQTWTNDPMGKMQLTPAELLQFQKFMSDNFEAARMIKTGPVLFIQGTKDKLVRPAGTWKLCEHLATANHQLVLSKTGEHLIFEDNQFSPEDLLFVRTWIHRNVVDLDASAIASAKEEPAVLSSSSTGGATPAESIAASGSSIPAVNLAMSGGSAPNGDNLVPTTTTTTPDTVRTAFATAANGAADTATGIAYWIELYRNGKTYRCNNKIEFKSGDAIRFHITLADSGYAYVVMKEGSSGKSSVLFPTRDTGTANFLQAGQDHPLPSASWLKFDEHPGVERVSLMVARDKIDPSTTKTSDPYVTAYVSNDVSGTKDLVPTRMQLSWDDPTPVIIPDDFADGTKLAGKAASVVRLTSGRAESVLAVDIALSHR